MSRCKKSWNTCRAGENAQIPIFSSYPIHSLASKRGAGLKIHLPPPLGCCSSAVLPANPIFLVLSSAFSINPPSSMTATCKGPHIQHPNPHQWDCWFHRFHSNHQLFTPPATCLLSATSCSQFQWGWKWVHVASKGVILVQILFCLFAPDEPN